MVTLIVGAEEFRNLLVMQFIAGVVISICVFTYMSWTRPAKPYFSAFVVGILAILLGVFSSALLIGDLSRWDPVSLIPGVLTLLVAVPLGVSLGAILKRRGTADS